MDTPSQLRHHKSMKALIISTMMLFASNVLAKTIFEPSLGVTHGGFQGAIQGSPSITDGTEIQADYTALGAGFRYGITREYIHLTAVVDAYLVNLSTDQDIEDNFVFKPNIGVGVGYEWNIPIRTYLIIGLPFSGLEVSYYFSESMTVGFKYNNMKLDFAGSELTVDTFGVAVSFPIEFDYPGQWWRKKNWL